MSNLQAAVRGLASPSLSPEALCARLNALLCRNIASDRFVTLFYAHLDGPARQLRYVSAGHNPPFVLHRDGSHERLREGGLVLGVFANQSFKSGTVQLQSGDRMVLYTDGVTKRPTPKMKSSAKIACCKSCNRIQPEPQWKSRKIFSKPRHSSAADPGKTTRPCS